MSTAVVAISSEELGRIMRRASEHARRLAAVRGLKASADDAVAVAYLAVAEALESDRYQPDKGDVGAWAYGWYNNAVRDFLQAEHKKRTREVPDDSDGDLSSLVDRAVQRIVEEIAADDLASGEALFLRAELYNKTVDAMATLDPRDSEVLRLRAQGVTLDEVAERFGTTTRTIQRHVEAARQLVARIVLGGSPRSSSRHSAA